jgi:hypothetical protein
MSFSLISKDGIAEKILIKKKSQKKRNNNNNNGAKI